MNVFDMNGCIGEGAYGRADFPGAEDLISHMNYLGIDRSLTWHVQARDLCPSAGNRKLTEEISKNAEFSRRLIPAFVATPACFYEDGVMDEFREAFKERGLRALRIFPRTSRFDIRTIERVLGDLSRFEPVVAWDFKDSNGFPDCAGLSDLALKFTGVKFVLTELMWGQFNNAVDLMWRADNVYIDISWLHVRDAIEFLKDEFGAERVLFGTGFKSHYGAAAAMLNHARVTGAERSLIAGGNAERLLGLEPLRKKLAGEPPLIEEKPLWKTFREGKPLRGVEVIDAHTHTAPFTRGWIIRDNPDVSRNISNLVKQMDSCGVAKSVIVPEAGLFGEPVSGQAEAEKIIREHSGRFMGYLAFNPWYADRLAPVLDDFFARGFFIGFKVLPSYWGVPIDDPAFKPVWEYADRHSMPILLHTWDNTGATGGYNSPGMLEDIVPAFPGAQFILGHSGGGTAGRARAVSLAVENDNVFLEFCGSFTTRVDWLDTIGRAGIDRVLFGSDTGVHSLAWELGRFLSIPLPDEKLLPALADNFKRILGKRRGAPRPGD